MSKTRYRWWGYAKAVIRNYPALCKEYNSIHTQSTTASTSGMPRSVGVSRSTERAALRVLTKSDQREYDAVFQAIRDTRRLVTGEERLKLIDLVYWKRSVTLAGAANVLHISGSTAKRWNQTFITLVGENLGLLER